MKIYTQEEIDRIKKVQEMNEKMEEFFNEKRKIWNELVTPLFKVLSIDLSNPSNSRKLLDTQANVLTHRQQINEEINLFLSKRSRETTKVKKLRQDKFIFYATGFGVKTNLGEKGILIDGHLAENDRSIELIEMYIDFLRDTNKNLETFGYSIKNMIELMNLLKSH
jgi:threonine synthase